MRIFYSNFKKMTLGLKILTVGLLVSWVGIVSLTVLELVLRSDKSETVIVIESKDSHCGGRSGSCTYTVKDTTGKEWTVDTGLFGASEWARLHTCSEYEIKYSKSVGNDRIIEATRVDTVTC